MDKIGRGSARRVLAIGAPDADATVALADALASDGMLILMEIDRDRAENARRSLRSAGVGAGLTVIAGDPRRMLYKLAGPFDVIFCDDSDAELGEKLTKLLAPHGVLITQDHKPHGT